MGGSLARCLCAGTRRRGPLPQRRYPAPAAAWPPPSRIPVAAPSKSGRAVLPALGIVPPRKDHLQGRAKGASPAAMTQAPPLKLIFHGKSGAYRGGRSKADSVNTSVEGSEGRGQLLIESR